MYTSPNFYVSLVYLLAAIPYAWMGLFAWRKRTAVAVTPFAWAMLGLSIWSFAYSLELFLPPLPLKLLFARVGYFGSAIIPLFFLFFALEYTDKSQLLTRRTRVLLWGIPVLTNLLLWGNDAYPLVWSGETILSENGLNLLSVRYEPFFWLQTVYSNALAFVAAFLLALEMLQRPRFYRVQISFVTLGILAFTVGSLLYVNGITPIPNLNVTQLLFLPIVTGISWTITRYRMLEVIPFEHLTVLKNMKDGVVVVNADGRILYINPLVETLFGHPEKDVIGQPLAQVSKEYGETLAAHLSRMDPRFATEMRVCAEGGCRIFEVTVSQIISKNKSSQSSPGSIIILHDITTRKKSEAALARREAMMSALNLAAERFLKESAWEHNIPGILERIGQAINVSRVYVFMNYTDGSAATYSSQCYEWAAAGVTPQIDNPALQHINLREVGFRRWEEDLSRGLTIHGVLREFPESEQAILREQNILSLAVVPIFAENQWWGFIGFDDCGEERRWEDSELEVLGITASIFGSAEVRARNEQRLLRRQQGLSLLQEIVGEALQAGTLRQMARNIVSRLANLISANECFITLWDEDSAQTTQLASYGANEDTYLPLQPVAGDLTLTELSLHLGHTVIVDDAYNSPYLDYEISTQCPSRSLIVLPLIAAKTKLGAIILAFKEHHHFQSEEVSICEQASGLIALAFEKFRAVMQAQRRADTSEALRKAGAAIAETLETNEAVSRILAQLQQAIPYDTASVQLLNGNELKIIGGSGFPDLSQVIGMRFPIPGNNPNSIVMETGKPHLLPEVGDMYEEFKKPPNDHIRSWLGVPLIFQERIIGLLAIDSAEPNHFTQENVSFVSVFADQVAVALENARTYEEAQNLAITDVLTGVYNRRGLFQVGEFEFVRSIRVNRPFSLLMLDIDYFKRVNDHYGHATGDQALRGLAERCRSLLRAMDTIGRYGGEEFAVLLPDASLESARIVAERMRQAVAREPFITDSGPLRITVSIGIAEANSRDTLNALIKRADAALYDAKHAGRNCVMPVKSQENTQT